MTIAQEQPITDPHAITIGMVKQVLELGEMLVSVLSSNEIEDIERSLRPPTQVTSSALDA